MTKKAAGAYGAMGSTHAENLGHLSAVSLKLRTLLCATVSRGILVTRWIDKGMSHRADLPRTKPNPQGWFRGHGQKESYRALNARESKPTAKGFHLNRRHEWSRWLKTCRARASQMITIGLDPWTLDSKWSAHRLRPGSARLTVSLALVLAWATRNNT